MTSIQKTILSGAFLIWCAFAGWSAAQLLESACVEMRYSGVHAVGVCK